MDFARINRKLWNDKTPFHLKSDFYKVESFIAGATSLNPVELDLLGQVEGLSILHLQCHFGMDTLSLARMGAKVTGVDIADVAIQAARDLSENIQAPAEFINCNIYDLPNYLDQQFDLVFTSYGTIGWLPDLNRWASLIFRYLKPGGRFIMAEFHPFIWMFDQEFKHIEYSYFNQGPIEEEITGSYADPDALVSNNSISWNQSLGEVISALLKSNMAIRSFQEHDFSPYNILSNSVGSRPGEFQVRGLEGKIPLLYSLEAIRE